MFHPRLTIPTIAIAVLSIPVWANAQSNSLSSGKNVIQFPACCSSCEVRGDEPLCTGCDSLPSCTKEKPLMANCHVYSDITVCKPTETPRRGGLKAN